MMGTSTPEQVLGVRRGRVLTPSGFVEADIRIDEEGTIVAVDPGACEGLPEDLVLDADGREVRPGAIDVHVHVDEIQGRFVSREEYLDAASVARRGGVTTMAMFATARRGQSIREALVDRERDVLNFTWHPTHWTWHLTPRAWGPGTWKDLEELAGLGLTRVKIYTTYRRQGLQVSYDRLRKILPRLAGLGITALVHCEDPEVLARADGTVPPDARPFDHARLRPPEAETTAIQNVAALSLATGCAVHVVHVTLPESVDVLLHFREMGAPLTWETGMHYLCFPENVLRSEGSEVLLCTPPFRHERAVEGLRERVARGQVDLLASDHCPFELDDKLAGDGDPRRTPMGIPGVGATAPVAMELLERKWALLSPQGLQRMLSEAPARLLGLWPRKGGILPGSDADLVVWEERQTVACGAYWPEVMDPWSVIPIGRVPSHVLLCGQPVLWDGQPLQEDAGWPLWDNRFVLEQMENP